MAQLLAVKATVRFGGVLDAFNRLSRIDTLKAFKELRGPARLDQRHHDRNTEAPDGRWPPLAASTIARNRYRRTVKGAKGRRTTRRGGARSLSSHKLLGRLPTALQAIVSPTSLIIRDRVKWSMAHQASAIVGHGARLPRRQFLWISDWLKDFTRKQFQRLLITTFYGSRP